MATTSNYGWTIPDDTDLVKNGALAIRTLGNAIDTTAAASFGGGLVLIQTQSASAISTVSFNNVFSATYDNYLIRASWTGSVGGQINMRLRSSGTDSTSNYDRQSIYASSTSVAGARTTAQTSWIGVGNFVTTENQGTAIELYNPFKSIKTTGLTLNGFITGGNIAVETNALLHTSATSYDGFSLIASAGNLTGDFSVFGFKK